MTVSIKKMIYMTCFLFFPLAVTGTGVSAGDAANRPPELERLISEAVASNRGLRAVAARAASLDKAIPSAGALDDPVLGLALANMPTDTFDFDQEPMTQKQFFVSQKIPWFGKLSLKEKMAALDADRQSAVLEKQKRQLIRKVSGKFYQLWYVERALANNLRLKELLTQVREVTETGYASGKAQEKDLIQAQLEISRNTDERITLQAERRSLDRDINGILNRDRFQSVTTPSALPQPETALDRDSLKQALMNSNPEIRILRIELQKAELESELAGRNFWPDSEWRLTYGQRDDINGQEMADFLSASVMFNVPLWQGRKQAPLRDAKRELTGSARMALEDLLSTLPYELDAVCDEIEGLIKNYRFYTDVMINQAADLARSSMSSYQVGKLAFDIMIRAQIRQIEVELKSDQYLRMIYTKQAELEELTGRPIRGRVESTDQYDRNR